VVRPVHRARRRARVPAVNKRSASCRHGVHEAGSGSGSLLDPDHRGPGPELLGPEGGPVGGGPPGGPTLPVRHHRREPGGRGAVHVPVEVRESRLESSGASRWMSSH